MAVAVVVTGVPWGGGVGVMFVGDRTMEVGSALSRQTLGVPPESASGLSRLPEP